MWVNDQMYVYCFTIHFFYTVRFDLGSPMTHAMTFLYVSTD